MNFTNKYGFPRWLSNSILAQHGEYDAGTSDYTATTLLAPARITRLRARHHKELVVDVADLWAIYLGQIVHDYFERTRPGGKKELRLFSTVLDKVVSGQMDRYDRGKIIDFKTGSVASLAYYDHEAEWTAQLNIYACLARRNGMKVTSLEVQPIMMDWRPPRFKRPGYPITPASPVKLDMWHPDLAEEYLNVRVAAHKAMEHVPDDELPYCTAHERWDKESVWKVKSKGRKKSWSNCASLEEAEAKAATINKPTYIEHVPGERTRCAGNYCKVADFCNQWKEHQCETK